MEDALVSKVLYMLSREAEREIGLVVVTRKEVQWLTTNLQYIQPVLVDAERRQLEEVNVRLWLETLRSVIYDIEDVLDELNYEILKSQFIQRKVWSFCLLSSRFSIPKFTLGYRFAVKISNLNKRLYVIAVEKDKYGFLSSKHIDDQIELPIRTRTPVVNISEAKGGEVEEAQLENLLLGKSSELPKINPISIVWMGGIGKTTLAKLVYNDKYGFLLSKHIDEQLEWPIRTGTSVVDISEVKGREDEKEQLLNSLLGESSGLTKIHPIYIVGMGGIGKTTLAKLVYNDESVKSHFEKRIWVCVSEPFKKTRVAKTVLESLVGHNSLSLFHDSQRMAVKIQESVKGKKFLLVLDDVWSEDLDEWKELENCLIGGSYGSKILVTTRNENVAKCMGCIDNDMIRVGLLSEEESLSLFCDIAFCWWFSEGWQHLETIVSKIVERCEGLPLALKTSAGILSFKKRKQEWENVLDSNLWKLKKNEPRLFVSLCSSFYDLPSPLKQCFLYCAIFPKGYRMSKDELISLWMAHGFLEPMEDGDKEIVGDDYFHNLGVRSLFQDFEVEEKFNRLDKTYCRMHHVVHDLAKKMMGSECLCTDVNRGEAIGNRFKSAYGDDVYHLHLSLGEDVEFIDVFNKKLRSLVILPSNNNSLKGTTLSHIFSKLTCLRSLSLSRCRLENIPSNINKLVHLRWLKLSKNYALKELPKTICELYHLQTLSVNWCNGLTHFPNGVEKLTNLRHLKNDYTYFLLPKGIGKLSGLRKLLRITIDPRSKDAFCLRDLENLSNISGSLTIFFVERERDTIVEDAKQAQLKEKKQITALSLNFPERVAEEWMQSEDEKLAEALKPPKSLEMLRITSYAGTDCPRWINTITSLKKLKLWYWSNCEHLPALAKLPSLEHIEFNHFGRVQKVAAEFYQMDDFRGPSSSTAPLFPKLKNLQFMNMIEWEEWNDYEGDEQVMPCLSYLSIENCPKLKALPNFILKKATMHKKIS